MGKQCVILLLILLSAGTSFAQSGWMVYDTTNSPLPDNRTYKVLEDDFGNIWASTEKGLIKFDGVNWTVYDSVPGTNYALKNLFALAYDDINDWIYVSMPGVLVRYDGTNWNTWPHMAYSNEDVVDSQGRVWMALYNLGVGVFDGTSFTYYDTTNSPIQSPYIFDIEKDFNDNFWIIAGPGLTKFDGTTWTIYDTSNSPLPSNSIFGIGVDNNNLLWVHGATNQNDAFVYSFDGTTWTPFDTTICQPLYAYSFIEHDAMNRLWMGTYGEGLQMINNSACSTYNEFNSPLPTNAIHDIHISSGQTLWITTQLSGLVKVDLPVGLNDAPETAGSIVFPNPTSTELTLTNFEGGEVHLYNILGEIIHSTTFASSEPKSVAIDVTFLVPGLYMIKTTDGIFKFVKQ